VVYQRKEPFVLCPHCGCRVLVRLHTPLSCDRFRRVFELRGQRWTLAEIGRELGISRERVRQILQRRMEQQ
jgi:DNA-directed RNA polymerase specialized sigma subunit